MPAKSGGRLFAVGLIAAQSALLMTTGACQRYERSPLDLSGHRAAFLARTPDSLDVAAFAASLGETADGPPPPFDLDDGVSSSEAQTIALVYNADLRLARLRAGVTRASADNAGLWTDPTLSVDLTRIIESVEHPWKLASAVGLTLPVSGRLEVEKKRAGREHDAELARVAQDEWRVRMDVRRAWTNRAAVETQLETTREFLSRVEPVFTIVEKMERAGEMPRTEARLFRIERADTLARLAMLEGQGQEAALRLAQVMGLSPDAQVPLTTTGIGPEATEMDGPGAAGITREALERRSPRMLVVNAEYEAAEKGLELEIRRQYPDLHIGPGYGNEDGNDEVLLGLGIPLPIFNANRQGIAEARARRELARAGAETMLERTITDWSGAEIRLRAAARQRAMVESEIIPLVDDQYADARRLAQLGEVNTLVLLESLTRQQQAKVRLIEARQEEALAAIELAELAGPGPDAAFTNTPPPATEPGAAH